MDIELSQVKNKITVIREKLIIAVENFVHKFFHKKQNCYKGIYRKRINT